MNSAKHVLEMHSPPGSDNMRENSADRTSTRLPSPNTDQRGLFTLASLKALIIALLIYWGVSALLLPVTTSDCQVYNLARLSVAERTGFWQAETWNSIREVTY